MFFPTLLLSILGSLLCMFVHGQAPNTLQGTYPDDRTQSVNGTFMLVPLSKTIVQAAGFEEGKHPVLVATGFDADIQMQVLGVGLSIPTLIEGLVYIPFVDRLGDGHTPFLYPLFQIIGGDNGQLLANTVPSLAGTAEGSVLFPGSYIPDQAAYSAVDQINNPGLFTTSGDVQVVANSISGPSALSDPVYQISFYPTAESPYSAHTFHSVLNQPMILYTGQCYNNVLYFDNPYADPWMSKGTVTLYSGSLLDTLQVGIPRDFAGTYENVFGFAATAENVGLASQSCAEAAASLDTAAST